MLVALVAALAAQAGPSMPQQTTPVGALSACQAKTLAEAAKCLRTNLSESDRAALVAADGPSAIRGQIDRFVQFEFRLYEPDSPVGNWLRERGITSRLAQSSVIIEEYLAQQREMTLDLREVAKATRDLPDGTAPTAAEFAASRARQVPSTKIPKDDCATITKLPPDELGECYMEGDRIKVTHKKASAN